MDTFDTIRTMLAVRRYQEKPVPEATLRRVVEAGRLTGSAKNLQPWHFVVVQDRATLQKLGALARTGAHVAQAGAAVVVAVDKTPLPCRTRAGRSSRCCSPPGRTGWARTGSASGGSTR